MKTLLFDFTSGSLLLLIFLLITNSKKINKKGNRWLALFLTCIFFLVADESLSSNHIYHQIPGIIGFENFFIFLSAPALYFSVLFYVSVERTFSKKDYLHFAPALLFSPVALLSLFENSALKLKMLSAEPESVSAGSIDILLILLFVQITTYIILCYKILLKHRKNVRLFSSSTEIIDLNWLQQFIKALGVMLAFWMLNSFFPISFFIHFSPFVYFTGILFLAYHALRQNEIYPFSEPDKLEIKELIRKEEADLPKRQLRFSEQELNEKKQYLQQEMELRKYYLEDTLSLPKLAEYTQNSTHDLSYIINEGFGENFFQFVNRYRVEEAKRLLLSSKSAQLNILGIAYESGFNSKTTFNTTFKKMTGVSPSEFVKNNT